MGIGDFLQPAEGFIQVLMIWDGEVLKKVFPRPGWPVSAPGDEHGVEVDQNSINKLYFGITALLVVHEAKEPVSFDALLQPSTLQYSISNSRRIPAVRLGV